MNTKSKKKTGPKPITYIPPQFRHIPGAEHLTTHRQLIRLREYLQLRDSERSAYFRLGASVPQYGPENTRKPSATYAVMIDGVVSIIRLEYDPRAAERWVSNARRPWNMSHEFAGMEVEE
jgi:hypothetical protein